MGAEEAKTEAEEKSVIPLPDPVAKASHPKTSATVESTLSLCLPPSLVIFF